MPLWEVEVRPAPGRRDAEGERVAAAARAFGVETGTVRASRAFLIEGDVDRASVERDAVPLLADPVVEIATVRRLPLGESDDADALNVLFQPGVTDNVARSAKDALGRLGVDAANVATVRRYRFDPRPDGDAEKTLTARVLANDSIEHVVPGPLRFDTIAVGHPYTFAPHTVPLADATDDGLVQISREGQLSLSLEEMRTVRGHFAELGRDPTDCELETIAQTWSEHCSHKTLAGRIRYVEGAAGSVPDAAEHPGRSDHAHEILFDNMLRETIFAATVEIRGRLGGDDWCVSVFEDNAGVVHFEGAGDDATCVCFKVETHNHPSAIEPYGGANTGLGGVIRDPLGTGLGAKPLCNTDVFCFAPPDTPADALPPGVLHPRTVADGVVAGVRDYGNRMGIPTVNGAVLYDDRYLGNPLVFCGNVALIPRDKVAKAARPGDLVVALGGRTGRDGIHGATFSSVELTEDSETISGGSVQIGDPVTEKMLADVLLAARDRGLYTAVTDCGAGGFSSAVGEMAEHTGAHVRLESAPLKYPGLSYTEIWISEAQERMVLSVPPGHWEELHALCASEGVEATMLGEFTDTGRLHLSYEGHTVCDLAMSFLHDGRPDVLREARFTPPTFAPSELPTKERWDDELRAILASPNVASKEWVVRQYDHEVQAGSVVKPLVGAHADGPGDAAVVRPLFGSTRGLVVGCGINPRFGDLDPYRMACSALDEAVRNVVACGADPEKIAVLDNFCWGNTEHPETLGSLVRAALGCRDAAVAYGTPFISGKDSLYNEFAYTDAAGGRRTVAIPPTLLVSALGQIPDVSLAVTSDLKEAGNPLYVVGVTRDELGGSHLNLVLDHDGGAPPAVDFDTAPRLFAAVHAAILDRCVRACHDLSEGGLAVAAAESAFAGDLGADLDLDRLPTVGDLTDAAKLFAESNTRFLVEISADRAADFERHLTPLSHARIGVVTDDRRLRITAGGAERIASPIDDLKAAWQGTFAGF